MAFKPFYSKAAAVTVSDTVAIATGPTRGLMVTTAGAYTILLQDDTVAVVMTLAASVIYPLNVKRVNLTSAASAAGIVAFY
jgi:hypothetical protein